MFQKLKNLLKKKSKQPVEIIKSPFQLFLEKHKYSSGEDLLVLPDTYQTRSDINPKVHSIIYLQYLKHPAIIKT